MLEEYKMEQIEETKLAINQVWKHKYSGRKIKLTAYIVANVWDYINLRTKTKSQVVESELMDHWKIVHENKKQKLLSY
jgi:hypothetical protein